MLPSTKPLLPPLPSLSPLLITILVFTLLPSSTTSPIASCSSSTCGDSTLQIPYPFWLAQDPRNPLSSHCGYPDLMLHCLKNTPILTLPDAGNYTVTAIDSSTKTLSLVDTAALSDAACPRPLHNLSINVNYDKSSLSFTSEDTQLFFYYNCSKTNMAAVPLGCSGGRYSYVLTSDVAVMLRGDCEESVMAPAMHAAVVGSASFLSGDVVGVVEKGFQLHWDTGGGDECRSCEDSGRLCGQAQEGFVCICESGINGQDCGGGNATATDKRSKGLIIGLSVAGGLSVTMVCCFCFLLYTKRNKRRRSGSTLLDRIVSFHPFSKSDSELGSSLHAPIFKYDELYEATNGFDDSKELGDGGFGTVYKGKLRDGRVVAVKRLYENNYRRVEQFMNEVKILSLLRHQNLVSLYGCTSRHSRELLLVYEFVPNGTVADHLHGSRASQSSLPWKVRMSIAIETADALNYLHSIEPQIIHRDIKTSNILLDSSFHVKVGDFGLSRLFPLDVTHVSTAPQGTPGYVDPEYHQCYQLTDKSDVYSFGVVLMELISSKPAVDITRQRSEINLATMAISKIQKQELHEFVDQNLGYQSDYNINRMINQVAELAFQCLQSDGEMRPCIKDALEILTGIENGGQKKEIFKELNDTLKEEARLLKSSPPYSPNSVTVEWVSRGTTPNTSV